MTNLTHNSFLCVYFISLHVSSNLVLIIRRISCINTTSGICHSVSVTVCRSERNFPTCTRNGHRHRITECLPELKRPESCVDNPPSSGAEVTNTLELYHRLRSVPAPGDKWWPLQFYVYYPFFILCAKFYAARFQTQFFPSLLHYIKGWAGLAWKDWGKL